MRTRCSAWLASLTILLIIIVMAVIISSDAAPARPSELPWGGRSDAHAHDVVASAGGFATDASVAEAVRRSNFLRQDPAAINLTMRIGKAIGHKSGATQVDVAPDVWYAFQPAHAPSCADAELVAGVWTCGLRRLQCGCVAYAISHSTHEFADELEAITPCEVYRFGPAAGSLWTGTLSTTDGVGVPERTLSADLQAPTVKYSVRPFKLEFTGRVLSGRSLVGLMATHGHTKLDVLHLDLAGGEYVALDALKRDGFPKIATLSMQLHFLTRPLLDAAFGALWAAGFRDYRAQLLPSARQQVSFLGPTGVAPRSEPHDPEIIAARVAARAYARARPNGVSVGFPSWSCDETLVGFFGDGTKWVCGLRELAARRSCVVYSFGGAANTQFENAIRDMTRCEVHTFDLDCMERCVWGGACYAGPRLACHKVRVGGKDNDKTTPPTMSLPTMMRTLGHKHVDILKIDIEGAERGLFQQLAKQRFDWRAIGQVLLETHEQSASEDEGLLLGLIDQADGQLTAFHSEINIYHTQSREVAFVHDGTEGGVPSATETTAALRRAAERADHHLSSGACKQPCAEQPWRFGCRPSAYVARLGTLGAAHLARFERASVLPRSARYLVIPLGGGFGNQLAQLVSFTLAALLSGRIPVVLPMFAESTTELAFDLRRYFQSFVFPVHGTPTIRDAIIRAEARAKGGMSYDTLPCELCPKVQLNESELLSALVRDSTQVLRVHDFGSRYTNHPGERVELLLRAAVERFGFDSKLAGQHRKVYPALLQLLLQPTPLLTSALSRHRLATAPPNVAVHIRTGDAGMSAEQMLDATRSKEKTGSQGVKCREVGPMASEQAQDKLLDCVSRFANNRSIFFATDNARLAARAAQRLGSQLLPVPAGAPRHTFRPMDRLRNASAPGTDVHIKQMMDFVLLSSASTLMLTCGSYGESAAVLGTNSRVVRYSAFAAEFCHE
jgi:hypothetical protein